MICDRDDVANHWGKNRNGAGILVICMLFIKASAYGVSSSSDENVLELVVIVVQLCAYTEKHWII